MRYSDVVMMSRGTHGEEQTGRSGQAASSCGSTAACRQESAGSRTPDRSAAPNRIPLAQCPGGGRYRRTARCEQGRKAAAAWRRRAVALICDAARGASGARLLDAAVDPQAGAPVDRARVWRSIQRGPRFALARTTGLFEPEARPARLGARRGSHRAVAQAHLAGAKKTPLAKDGCSSSSTSRASRSGPRG
jgi:hypothetical protein